MIANGTFKVDLQPLGPHAGGTEGITLGRMAIAKTFTGALQATSTGEMLMVQTPKEGSAGYVAVEQVTGRLDGRAGSFALQHYGIMHNGENKLLLEVVPGSGSGELTGIAGQMSIDISAGVHHYIFNYSLE